MQLSHQTKTGLEIYVQSITRCVEIMLEEGAEFVLTHNFNQDPLEQYFGHLRHKGGANQNPTVYDDGNTMTQLLAIRSQALAPKGGNIARDKENQPILMIINCQDTTVTLNKSLDSEQQQTYCIPETL